MRHIPLRRLRIGQFGMLAVILGGTAAVGASPMTTSLLLALAVALAPSIGETLHPATHPTSDLDRSLRLHELTSTRTHVWSNGDVRNAGAVWELNG